MLYCITLYHAVVLYCVIVCHMLIYYVQGVCKVLGFLMCSGLGRLGFRRKIQSKKVIPQDVPESHQSVFRQSQSVAVLEGSLGRPGIGN